MMKRSKFLVLLMSSLVALLRRPRFAFGRAPAGHAKPLIGATRWDAWYDPGQGGVAKAVEASLAPEKYHFRLPFFAKVLGKDAVWIDGSTQETIDREIRYAADAGLAYWAFGAYPRSDALTNALSLYLKSSDKNLIKFAMLTAEVTFLAAPGVADWHLSLMSDPAYQTVLGRRPLYFIGILSNVHIKAMGNPAMAAVIRDFRAAAKMRDLADPYIVVLAWTPAEAAAYCHQLGCDAIGAYGVNGGGRAAPFSALVAKTEEFWEDALATKLPLVPPIVTGLDRRPRVEHPLPWDVYNPDTDQMDLYYETAKPPEIASHIADCIRWMQNHPNTAEANAALIYAWNENDEGGWLIPTYPNDTSRLDAIRGILRPS